MLAAVKSSMMESQEGRKLTQTLHVTTISIQPLREVTPEELVPSSHTTNYLSQSCTFGPTYLTCLYLAPKFLCLVDHGRNRTWYPRLGALHFISGASLVQAH